MGRGRGVASRLASWAGSNGAPHSAFPLAISGRHLVTSTGAPFLLCLDTPWSIAVQLTHAQIDTYLTARAAQGFTGILFNAIEHYFSSQSPAYRNAAGHDPFTSATDFASPNESYWLTVDYIVNACASRGMVAMMQPAYLGFSGGSQGWMSEVTAESAGDLQTYGAWLANRYTQGNVVWCMGGDYAGDTTQRTKQWHIVTGIRSVRTSDVITGHTGRHSRANVAWAGYAGFNLNNIYVGIDNITDDDAALAYAESLPFFLIEGGYEGETTTATVRLAAYTAMLSGACGYTFGNNPIWGFGEEIANGGAGAAAALASDLNSTGAGYMTHFAALFGGYAWEKLQPRTDASLVTSSLGTSGTTGRVCPALASDGSFAMIWTNSVNLTVAMANLSPSSVRGRWFNPADGTWATASGSPFANSGSQSFTAPGERVLVLDAA